MKRPIYMDHQATTPIDPRVLAAMLPVLAQDFGNAASRHHLYGSRAEELVEQARSAVASLIGASPEETIFTSGATESNNLALKGAAEMYRDRGTHIVTSSIEHKSVLEPLRALERRGFSVTLVPVDRQGRISVQDVQRAIRPETVLISVMHANNEVGVLQPVWEIGRIAKGRGVLFHCDATQAVGKLPVSVQELGVDLMSFSAHKMYGPKGVGALYVRGRAPHVRLMPLVDGGGHERGLRSGTLNVPAIVGFAKACEIAAREMGAERVRLEALRNRLLDRLREQAGEVHVNGSMVHRLPHNLHVSFPYVEAELLIDEIRADVAVSSGAACMSATVEPSYVLKAMGVGEELAHTSIRFSLGRFTTGEDVEIVAARVGDAVKRLRERSPLAAMAGDAASPALRSAGGE